MHSWCENRYLCSKNIIDYSIFIILAYVFEKVLNINCSPEEESGTLQNIKEKCKNNKQCIGVYQKTCNDDEDAYQCVKNQTSSSHVQDEGCLYRKIGIGK